MYERRRERRLKVLKAGKIVLSDLVAFDCTIRDISPGGAHLEFDTPISLPAEFNLRIVSADLLIPAATAWQRRLEAGVRFTGVGVIGPIGELVEECARAAA